MVNDTDNEQKEIRNRFDIVNKIGRGYLQSNIENGEFSYRTSLQSIGKNIEEYYSKTAKRRYEYLDLRFVHNNISILVETKNSMDKWDIDGICEQLQHYVDFENELTGNKIIAILADTEDSRTLTWYGKDLDIVESKAEKNIPIKSFSEYEDDYFGTVNNKYKVLQSTFELNELLHSSGINEKIRSQFVGTCLLSLKMGLNYENQSTGQIIGGIEDILTSLLNKNLNKAQKLTILKTKVLDSQDVRSLSEVYLKKSFIKY